jgi:hypothetical protein
MFQEADLTNYAGTKPRGAVGSLSASPDSAVLARFGIFPGDCLALNYHATQPETGGRVQTRFQYASSLPVFLLCLRLISGFLLGAFRPGVRISPNANASLDGSVGASPIVQGEDRFSEFWPTQGFLIARFTKQRCHSMKESFPPMARRPIA